MKRWTKNLLAALAVLLCAIGALAFLYSAHEAPGTEHRSGPKGRNGGISYDNGWIVRFDTASLSIDHVDYHWDISFIAVFLLAGLYLFLWSGIPATMHLELGPKKINPGVCQKCGYDLRASPERCPECGTFRRPLQ